MTNETVQNIEEGRAKNVHLFIYDDEMTAYR